MCQLKSGIILKDRVYIPNHDHHTEMLEELGIGDTKQNAERIFVRAELIPPDEDVFAPLEAWNFNVDQDIIPDWFVKEHEKTRMAEAVKEWAENYIHINKNDFRIGAGAHYLKNCKRVTCNNSTVTAYGNSIVDACNNSTVTAYGNSIVTAYDNSIVTAYGNSIVTACNNSTVTAYDNSIVTAYGNSTVAIPKYSSNKRDNIILFQNATLKDCKTKTIYQCGDWKLINIGEGDYIK